MWEDRGRVLAERESLYRERPVIERREMRIGLREKKEREISHAEKKKERWVVERRERDKSYRKKERERWVVERRERDKSYRKER